MVHKRSHPLKGGPAGFKRLLGADTNDLPRLHAAQGVQDPGNQGTELLETIGARDDHNNRNARGRDVLLKRNVLVDGEEPFEAFR